MNEKVATMLYDMDCGICTYFIKKWQAKTGGAISYEPYQQSLNKFPDLTADECRHAVQLVTDDGKTYTGAHAVFKAFDLAQISRVPHWLYDNLPFCGRIAEFTYQWVAHRRMLFSKLFLKSVKKCE